MYALFSEKGVYVYALFSKGRINVYNRYIAISKSSVLAFVRLYPPVYVISALLRRAP